MSTITTNYRPAVPASTPRRAVARGAVTAWHCGIAYTTTFLARAEALLFVFVLSVTAGVYRVGALSRAEAVGTALLFVACRAAAYAGGRRAFVALDDKGFLKVLARSSALALAGVGSVFWLRPSLLPPLELAVTLPLCSAAASVLIRSVMRALLRRGRMVEDCLILGSADRAGRFFEDLRSSQPGAVTPVANGSPDGHCVVDYDQLISLAQRRSPSRLIVVEPAAVENPSLHDILIDCKLRGMKIEEALDAYERLASRIWVEGLRPEWVIYARAFRRDAVYRAAKRALDVTAALVLLALTFPLLLLVALAIKIESAGPVLFAQERVGHNGRTFTLYKFRSMRRDAEAQSGPVWAGENDARITPLGRILRKCRIDELPQIWNVLRGEMSFVGPRPERPYFVDLLRQQIPFYDLRHYVMPGITGWAQVSYPYGASVEDAYQKLQYDLYYGKHTSLVFDVLVLLKTVRVVLMGRGAR